MGPWNQNKLRALSVGMHNECEHRDMLCGINIDTISSQYIFQDLFPIKSLPYLALF